MTATPDTNKLFGHIEAGADFVDHGGEGWETRGAANVPLISDKLAVSVSGFYRRNPGFIDFTALSAGRRDDGNPDKTYGGRAALLFKPIDSVKITLSALDQELRGTGGPATLDDNFAPTDPLTNSTSQTLTTSLTKNRLFSGRVDADLGFATLSSITGYGQTRYRLDSDLTYIFAGLFGAIDQFIGLPVARDRAAFTQTYRTNKLTQEVRLASNPGGKLDWLVGGFYTHEKSKGVQILDAVDPASAAVTNISTGPSPSTFREIAAFGDATYHFTNQLSLQGGVRYAENRQHFSTTFTGPLVLLTGPGDSHASSRDHSVTWLASPQFKLNSDLMLYGRVATGYRPGGPNSGLTPDHLTFDPDRTINYEVGIKTSALNHKLTFTADAFWIDWKHVQLTEIDPVNQIGFIANGDRARSRGVEAEASYRLWKGGVVAANGTYTDATLRGPLLGDTVGVSGDRLPLSPRWSGNLSVDQTFLLAEDLRATLGGTVTYLGKRYDAFPSVGQVRGVAEGFTAVDLRAGVVSHGIAFNLYARNVTNRQGLLGVDTAGSPFVGIVVQPRTFGGMLSFNF